MQVCSQLPVTLHVSEHPLVQAVSSQEPVPEHAMVQSFPGQAIVHEPLLEQLAWHFPSGQSKSHWPGLAHENEHSGPSQESRQIPALVHAQSSPALQTLSVKLQLAATTRGMLTRKTAVKIRRTSGCVMTSNLHEICTKLHRTRKSPENYSTGHRKLPRTTPRPAVLCLPPEPSRPPPASFSEQPTRHPLILRSPQMGCEGPHICCEAHRFVAKEPQKCCEAHRKEREGASKG